MKPSGRQLAIMHVLWARGEATVAEVQAALDLERPLAYTTVATVMSRMERRGLITHRGEGRVFHYRPAVSEGGIGRSMVGELVERIFGGSPAELVSHLLDTGQVDASELDRIKRLVRQHEARRRANRGGRQ
jgi:predicted transcriptional regulator